MEVFRQELDEGRAHLRVADHLVTITFPLVMDARLLLTAVDNLFTASRKLMASLLHYEVAFKRVPVFSDDYDSICGLFRTQCMPRYNLSRDYWEVAGALKDAVDAHKASAVEFARRDNFVICSDSYSVRKVTAAQLKGYVAVMKRMLSEVEGVVLRYEGIFGRGTGRAEARRPHNLRQLKVHKNG